MEEREKKEAKPMVLDTLTTNSMVITVKGLEDRIYHFYMPFNSPLTECYAAAVNAANEIARLFNEAIEKQKEKEAAENKDTTESKKD